MTLPNAINVLKQALVDDIGYYHSWEANIAMAFYDEYIRQQGDMEPLDGLMDICTNAADNFLQRLIKE